MIYTDMNTYITHACAYTLTTDEQVKREFLHVQCLTKTLMLRCVVQFGLVYVPTFSISAHIHAAAIKTPGQRMFNEPDIKEVQSSAK